MNALSDALIDLRRELEGGAEIEAAATEIAADYGLNPVLLRRKFDEQFPLGLPVVDHEKANRLQAEVNRRTIERNAAQARAMREFFAIPANRVGIERLLGRAGL